jgi:hypothetical protein
MNIAEDISETGQTNMRASKAKFSQEIKLVKSNSTRDGWHMDTDYR